MKGDFSKETFRADKHFHDVLMQQGRVLLDTDWNEQARLNAYRTETGTKDIIGLPGAPHDNAGFKIEPFPASPPAGDLVISKGHFYVDGILCENDGEEDIFFENQPNLPLQALPTTPGNYLFYLDVWLRHITAIEDDSLREVALGGPDTTTRTKVVWQVKYANSTADNCIQTTLPAETDASTITLSARSELTADATNSCELTATGGYRRLQNQLYRVEIHRGSDQPGGPTFKWSRDNGSVVVKWVGQDNVDLTQLKVSSLGKDELLGFHTGDWIELIDDNADLVNKPGILAKLSKPPKDNILFIDSMIDPDNPSATSVSIINRINPRIRKWDSPGELKLDFDTWIELEDGVQINVGTGTSKTGDYWTIPGRTPLADVEWLRDESNVPLFLPPLGIKHHFAKLAILNLDASGNWTGISDCRNLFPALTELTSLYYVGGDGQEAMPGSPLPEALMVGVANGSYAIAGAKVKFEILSGGGSLDTSPDGIVVTGVDGIAKCNWTLGNDTSITGLQIQASLLDEAGNIVPQRLPVIFGASLKADSNDNKKNCSVIVGTKGDFKTLEEAIDKMQDEKNICICLLPEEHKINNLKIADKAFVKITGCGSLITMEGEEVLIRADIIALHGITINTLNEKAAIRFQATEIDTDYCKFTCLDSEFYIRNPFIFIAPFEQVADNTNINIIHWNNTSISIGKKSNGIALALAQRVGGWIENNIINGAVVLQYSDSPDWTTDNAVKIQDMLQALQFKSVEQLIVHANVLCNVMTNAQKIIDNNVIPKTLIISENVFLKTISELGIFKNSLVAEHINLINNQFLEDRGRNLVAVVGVSGAIIGNIGVKDNTQIQIFLDNSIGVPPLNLNLVPFI